MHFFVFSGIDVEYRPLSKDRSEWKIVFLEEGYLEEELQITETQKIAVALQKMMPIF